MTSKNVWVASLAMPVMIAMLLLLAGSSRVAANTGQPTAANAEVKIDNFSFGPQTVTVPVGATVTWTNRDDIPHTVVSTDGVFKSKVQDTDEKFSYTFTKPGTYPYFCSVHPKMTGKIVVQCHLDVRISLHHDLPGHLRVDRTKVGICPWFGKRVGKLFIRILHLGLEHTVRATQSLQQRGRSSK